MSYIQLSSQTIGARTLLVLRYFLVFLLIVFLVGTLILLLSDPVAKVKKTAVSEWKERIPSRPNYEALQRPWFMRGGQQRPRDHQLKNIFPQEDPENDRIVNQLMTAMPADKYIPIMKILVADGYNVWGVSGGRIDFLVNRCPVDRCTLTADPRKATAAHAILYRDNFINFNFTRRDPEQIWIMHLTKNPYHTDFLPAIPSAAINWTASYRRDSDIVTPYAYWVYYNASVTEKPLEKNYAAYKTKKVLWVTSNCDDKSYQMLYVKELQKHIQVDIYGECGSKRCPVDDPECLKIFKLYKFYLAFEDVNCFDYITQKFFVNGLQYDMVPIAMGAPRVDYEAIAPLNSFIHVEGSKGPKELAVYLNFVDKNEAEYNSYFKWKGTGEFINTYFFCRLCAMLHANDLHFRLAHYSDLQEWWSKDTCTTGKWQMEK